MHVKDKCWTFCFSNIVPVYMGFLCREGDIEMTRKTTLPRSRHLLRSRTSPAAAWSTYGRRSPQTCPALITGSGVQPCKKFQILAPQDGCQQVRWSANWGQCQPSNAQPQKGRGLRARKRRPLWACAGAVTSGLATNSDVQTKCPSVVVMKIWVFANKEFCSIAI